MSNEQSAEVQRAIKLEERASRLRIAMLKDPELNATLDASMAATERGDVVTLEELDREFGTGD